MSSKHPARAILERFMEGSLSPAENREVVRHLLTGCRKCRDFTSQVLGGRKEDRGVNFQRIIARLRPVEDDVAREREKVPRVLAALLRQPRARREMLIRNSKSYQTVALCRRVLRAAFKAGFREPQEAVELAEVGLAVAISLDVERYGIEAVKDLEARAWATLGNARRIVADFIGAEEAFRAAKESLVAGSQDPLDEARLTVLEAQLYAQRRDYREALPLFDRATSIYRRLGESHRQGCTLVEKGFRVWQSGDSEAAIAILRKGLALLDPYREPRRVLTAKHNLLVAFNDCGRFREANQLLGEVRALHQVLGNPVDLLRFRWLEGRIALEQKELGSAERAFIAAQTGFVEYGLAFDAAQVSLDLARVYLRQGRLAEIRDLATEMLEIFRSLGVHREALAAVAIFQQAAEREQLSLAWLSSLATYLRKAEENKALRFRPAEPT